MQDFSYGIIPLQQRNGRWYTLLVQHRAGHWAFPKGHAEEGESPQEAAIRELQEETGVAFIKFISSYPIEESYAFIREGEKVFKKVVYYLGLVEGDVKVQEAEIMDFLWVSLEEAAKYVTFPETRKLCHLVMGALKE